MINNSNELIPFLKKWKPFVNMLKDDEKLFIFESFELLQRKLFNQNLKSDPKS